MSKKSHKVINKICLGPGNPNILARNSQGIRIWVIFQKRGKNKPIPEKFICTFQGFF